MNCDQVAREIDAYLDGELSAAEAEQLAGHVARCSDCSARFGPLLRTVRMLQTMPELRAPRELLPEVLAHVPERSAARMGWTLGLTGAAASSALSVWWASSQPGWEHWGRAAGFSGGCSRAPSSRA